MLEQQGGRLQPAALGGAVQGGPAVAVLAVQVELFSDQRVHDVLGTAVGGGVQESASQAVQGGQVRAGGQDAVEQPVQAVGDGQCEYLLLLAGVGGKPGSPLEQQVDQAAEPAPGGQAQGGVVEAVDGVDVGAGVQEYARPCPRRPFPGPPG